MLSCTQLLVIWYLFCVCFVSFYSPRNHKAGDYHNLQFSPVRREWRHYLRYMYDRIIIE